MVIRSNVSPRNVTYCKFEATNTCVTCGIITRSLFGFSPGFARYVSVRGVVVPKFPVSVSEPVLVLAVASP